MHVAAALARAPERPEERLVGEQRAVLDCSRDPNEVLAEDPPRPDRQVTYLRVAHLSVRQPDSTARRDELRGRVAREELVEDGRPRELDAVPGAGRREPPAVEDRERDEREPVRAHVTAARQIAANDSGSSEAPPTSAPSTAACAISSAAFSGLTEPP